MDTASREQSGGCDLTGTALVEESPEGATRPTVFDRKYALSRLGGLEDVLYEVMELMTTDSRRVHAEIDAAYRQSDGVALKRAAHTLKGAVSLVGAVDLTTRLKRVEDCAVAGDFDHAAVEFPEIDRQFGELQSRLASELQNRA